MRKRFYHTLSIQGNDFIAHWAYEERIFAHAQPGVKSEQFLHVNPCWASRNKFQRTLSIRWTNFIAGQAYAKWISSLAEHTRKSLKVKYFGRIECDFQKSCVTGPWDHKVSVSAKKNQKKKFHACVPLKVSQSSPSHGRDNRLLSHLLFHRAHSTHLATFWVCSDLLRLHVLPCLSLLANFTSDYARI